MKRESVQSSNIASIGYDAEARLLEVEFRNGAARWQYSDVSLEEYVGLLSAPSIGAHFIKHIREQKEGSPIVEMSPQVAWFEDCVRAVEEYHDAAFADRYRQRLPKRATPPEVKDKDRFLSRPEPASTPHIPVLRRPAPNSWYRVQLAVYPRTCPACGRAVAAVWQDHHLAHPVQTGWVGGWVCQASLDGQDCSRFVFIHREGRESDVPCQIVFNCQKTRALGVGEICAQVLAAKRAIAPKGIE